MERSCSDCDAPPHTKHNRRAAADEIAPWAARPTVHLPEPGHGPMPGEQPDATVGDPTRASMLKRKLSNIALPPAHMQRWGQAAFSRSDHSKTVGKMATGTNPITRTPPNSPASAQDQWTASQHMHEMFTIGMHGTTKELKTGSLSEMCDTEN